MGLNILERVALRVVRGALNGAIGKFTPYELCVAIEEDRNLWGNTPGEMRNKIQGYKNRFRGYFDKFSSQLTTATMVEWLHQDNPRLHNVITASTANYGWFNRQVNEFLNMIKEM